MVRFHWSFVHVGARSLKLGSECCLKSLCVSSTFIKRKFWQLWVEFFLIFWNSKPLYEYEESYIYTLGFSWPSVSSGCWPWLTSCVDLTSSADPSISTCMWWLPDALSHSGSGVTLKLFWKGQMRIDLSLSL